MKSVRTAIGILLTLFTRFSAKLSISKRLIIVINIIIITIIIISYYPEFGRVVELCETQIT